MKKRLKVLIVDDERLVCQNITDYLEDDGFVPMCAMVPDHAIDLLKKERFDAAIFDMRLPGKDGGALIIESLEIQPDLFCIIHTGFSDYRLTDELKAAGISDDHVFTKPIQDMALLADAIRKKNI